MNHDHDIPEPCGFLIELAIRLTKFTRQTEQQWHAYLDDLFDYLLYMSTRNLLKLRPQELERIHQLNQQAEIGEFKIGGGYSFPTAFECAYHKFTDATYLLRQVQYDLKSVENGHYEADGIRESMESARRFFSVDAMRMLNTCVQDEIVRLAESQPLELGSLDYEIFEECDTAASTISEIAKLLKKSETTIRKRVLLFEEHDLLRRPHGTRGGFVVTEKFRKRITDG